MNFLLRQIKKIKPHFEKGGRFEKFYSVFDGFESFLFVPETVTKKGSHVRDHMDLKR
ncbi:MAG: NADH:ubiquinone reductase (Na(+)-transporting) subunit B, partial [Bacteroidales bacterium]|nr:NADH:ubiquinone reductase (Na(+)-transporting) subunit B [Bacteroidales bacterium]